MDLELDQFKDVYLVIDKANDIYIQRQFVSQGDYKGRTLTVQITNNGSIGEVPGLTLNLNWHNEASGLTDLTAFTILDKTNSIFRIEYPENMMTPGKVYASIQIIQDGKVTNLKQFELIVQKLAGQPVGIVEKAEFSALVTVLADSNKFRTDIDSVINELNSKFDSNQAESYLKSITVLPETFTNLAAIQAKYPNGANGVMVTADNGHKYIWANSTWTDAGIYQAAGIAPNSVATEAIKQSAVTVNKIDGLTVNSTHAINRFDAKTAISGARFEDGYRASDVWVHSNYISVPTDAIVRINKAYETYMVTFDKFGMVLGSYIQNDETAAVEIALTSNVGFIMVNCYINNIDDYMLTINDPMPASYQPFTSETDSAEINWLYLKDNSVSPAKLNGTKIVKRRSANRYNEQSAVDGQVATIGGIINYSHRRHTDYLNVTPGDLITLSNAMGTAAVGYDLSKKPIRDWKYDNEQGETSIVIPENVFFIIINIMEDWPNFMFSVNEPLPSDYDPFVKNDIVDVSCISRSKFENKSAMMFGDSITWYDGHVQPSGTIAVGYETWLKQQLGFVEAQNLGISGAPFATGKTPDNGIGAKIESEYKTTDLVLIAGGTNDFKLNVPLGEIQPVSGTFDKTTSTGALQSALEHILTTNNDQEILLMAPIQRDNSNYSIYSTNKAGFKLDDYRQMIIKLGELYSIQVWDGYASSGLNLLNLDKYTLDGLHPNNAGFERISKSLCAYIKGVF